MGDPASQLHPPGDLVVRESSGDGDRFAEETRAVHPRAGRQRTEGEEDVGVDRGLVAGPDRVEQLHEFGGAAAVVTGRDEHAVRPLRGHE